MFGACNGESVPTRDLCDGVDRDCDGNANSRCVCQVGTTRPCYDGPAVTRVCRC